MRRSQNFSDKILLDIKHFTAVSTRLKHSIAGPDPNIRRAISGQTGTTWLADAPLSRRTTHKFRSTRKTDYTGTATPESAPARELPNMTEAANGAQITTQSKTSPAASLLALALGAAAVGAVAIGVLAIGRLAVGRLTIRKARFGVLEVDELTVRKLRVVEHQRPKA
jgi:hypothetical protein